MAALYRESDVLLKLSRVEGLGLAPLEGFHSGLPCVVTPYTGSEAYARHGENAMVVGFDDVPGTAATLDALARRRSLLAELGEGALATAAEWPSVEQATAELHGALDGDPRRGAARVRRAAAPPDARAGHRDRPRTHRSAARRAREALTEAEALVRELSASRDECGEMLEAKTAELARIRASAPYRLGSAVRRAARRVTGR